MDNKEFKMQITEEYIQELKGNIENFKSEILKIHAQNTRTYIDHKWAASLISIAEADKSAEEYINAKRNSAKQEKDIDKKIDVLKKKIKFIESLKWDMK